MRRLTRAAFLALALLPASLAAQQSARVFSPAELRDAGRTSLERKVARHGRATDAALRADVEAVIDRLRKASAYRQYELSWEMVDDSSLNASAAPGGVMIVNVGLPLFCREYAGANAREADSTTRRRYTGCLAAVIGHEFAHLALGHTDSLAALIRRREEIARRQNRAPSTVAAMRDSILMRGLHVERDQELAADRAGALYALRAGWEVQDAIDLFLAMDSVDRAGTAWRNQLTWLEGHPRASERAAMLEAHRARLKLNQRDFDDALALIDADILPDSAVALLDRVLADFPELPAARHAKAALLARQWMGSAPVRTLMVRPSMPTYDARFMTAIRGGDGDGLQQARTAFEQAFAVGAHPYTLADLAVLDAYAGDSARALRRATLAVERMPGDAEVLNNLGVVHYLARRYREAQRAFAAAERAAGDDLTPSIAFNVARATAALGDTTAAVQLLDRYIAHDDQSSWGREAVRLRGAMAGGTVAAGTAATSAAESPVVAGIRLGARSAETVRALGQPATRESTANGVVWRYPARGMLLLVSEESGVQAVVLQTPAAGAIGGVRVGDRAAALAPLGAPVERGRRGETGEVVVFDRGGWAIILVLDGGVVQVVSARVLKG